MIKPGIYFLRGSRDLRLVRDNQARLGQDNQVYVRTLVAQKNANTLILQFPFNFALKEEVRAMEGHTWLKDTRTWQIANTNRNKWAFDFLQEGKNPYKRYDETPPPWTTTKPFYPQQYNMAAMIAHVHRGIIAGEMGVGKTLVVQDLMEHFAPKWPLYVAPTNVIFNVNREFRNVWQSKVIPEFITYAKLRIMMDTWPLGKEPPDFLVFDESSALKHSGSLQSQAAQRLADMARDWHEDPFIIEMTGTPAPKDPLNWWKQAEIACPGYLKEGSPEDLKFKLGVTLRADPANGREFSKFITWLDDERKCKYCGQTYEEGTHEHLGITYAYDKPAPKGFYSSVNEVARLYKRLKGLTIVVLKKDCLNLPEKVYRIVKVEPTAAILRAAAMLAKRASTAIEALTLTRELSDGFQYQFIDDGEQICPNCDGKKQKLQPILDDSGFGEIGTTGAMELRDCDQCSGTGLVPKRIRTAKEVPCPKDEALKELLEECEEQGRIVIYAGFTASVERVSALCLKQGWAVCRVDGNGIWTSFNYGDPKRCSICNELEHDPTDHIFSPNTMLDWFQDKTRRIPKMAWVAQPASGGMSYTLTEAWMLVYYSSSFDGQSRMQSEDRIHRIGMDTNKGATIVDLIHLPTDMHVLNNLRKKRDLQSLTLGEVQKAAEQGEDLCEIKM